MDSDKIDKIFLGDLDNLPALSTKLVRIFTSSTFTDMLMERNTLMQFGYQTPEFIVPYYWQRYMIN